MIATPHTRRSYGVGVYRFLEQGDPYSASPLEDCGVSYALILGCLVQYSFGFA
jgi:hypothetical protein